MVEARGEPFDFVGLLDEDSASLASDVGHVQIAWFREFEDGERAVQAGVGAPRGWQDLDGDRRFVSSFENVLQLGLHDGQPAHGPSENLFFEDDPQAERFSARVSWVCLAIRNRSNFSTASRVSSGLSARRTALA